MPLLESVNSSLHKAVTYDCALSSWQELYRLVSCLDFGTGLATGCATLQSVSFPQHRLQHASCNFVATVTLQHIEPHLVRRLENMCMMLIHAMCSVSAAQPELRCHGQCILLHVDSSGHIILTK